MQATPRNRLASATSPYLQQHAGNPVDWYPWGDEALERAQREDRPILLSIGYAACHWCHVMAHESFEDADVAEVMNRLFVNIKVDREQRPDLDRIYQTAHQLLTGRGGGWPLTVFLTPDDRLPFFAGTYFPRHPRHGLPGFPDLLERIAALYRQRREEIREQNQRVQAAFEQVNAAPGSPQAALDATPLDQARSALAEAFDSHRGGFGQAPKFPQPTLIECLLRDYAHAPAERRESLHMACTTLRRMALGGIYDQVGGGFARYAVDDDWMIPHFEKMLSDNALLLALYSDAWQATGDHLFARIAGETADWALREMRDPAGGFYSALDADSEGEEGRFYLWTPDEVRALLTPEEYAVVAARFGLDGAANFEGRWHFHVHASLSELAKFLRLPGETVRQRLDSARRKLYAARCQRPWPLRDEKILTGWNALMIRGMARAGRLLRRDDLVQAATQALAFLRRELWTGSGLLASWRDGRAELPAYLDDHAFLLDAVLELLQCEWDSEAADFARSLAERLLAGFQDPDGGGFFFTAHDHEALPTRSRPLTDDALPAGNGVAARALLDLGCLLGEPRYIDAGERAVRSAWPALTQLPHAHATLLGALERVLRPPRLITLRGDRDACHAWREDLERYYEPGRLVFVDPGAAGSQVRAQLCLGTVCQAPVEQLESLRDQLGHPRTGPEPAPPEN
ncbi:thioredoxin domain-containing protein [Aquisalimonas lutea]|uniref:thioredoxin domain-containing protein n=1 Tax=Aquisalimonas lutea TaxID=1327750 RepID=UPI0025B307B2|nr:thioredoxin domain-containing protein [Aquisalimonas lutea]MDN3516054.1 thioredoxin domain-containing protein [Aquisalimonas lutea]